MEGRRRDCPRRPFKNESEKQGIGELLLGDVNNETIGHANLKNRSERTESLKRI